MKLRNKKTGEVKKMWKENICLAFGDCNKVYYSLAELNDEWEDYEPKEPLIKDEKMRKAVRAWWETVPDVITDKRILYKNNQDLAVGVYSIFCGAIHPETLEVGNMYTIAELCGEDDS